MEQSASRENVIAAEFAAKIKAEGRNEIIMRWAPLIVLAALFLLFTFLKPSVFASVSNLATILNQLAIPLLVAMGLTFVIMIGSIDLSIDGTVGMAGSVLSVLVLNSSNANNLGILGICLAILSCVGAGYLIGWIHVKFKIPSFMVSFAFMNICIGLALLSYKAIPSTIRDPWLVSLPKAALCGIPFITWVAIVMLGISYLIQEYTPFGRHIYAVGTDESIPKAVGVNVNRVKIMVFTYAGLLYGIAGVLGAIRLGRGEVGIGKDMMFPAQAAVVIGGTALAGGNGGMVNTLIGTLIMVVLDNGLTTMQVNPYIKTGLQGLIILAAIALTVKRGIKIISK